MSSRFTLLARFLEKSNQEMVELSFDEIEKIVGVNLPRSASEYRAWWANSISHSHARHGWLVVGYKTAEVDMEKQTLVFYKTTFQQPSSYSNIIATRPQSRQKTIEGGERISDEGALLDMAGGKDNVMRMLEAIKEYINGEISELELGQYMRKYWPR